MVEESQASAMAQEPGESDAPDTLGQADNKESMKSLLADKIKELEDIMQTSEPSLKEAAKLRKKQIREISKLARDASLTTEAKVSALEAKSLELINSGWRLDRSRITLEGQLEASKKTNSACAAEVERLSMMKEKLQNLSRELHQQNQALTKSNTQLKQKAQEEQQTHNSELQQQLSGIQQRLEGQWEEAQRILEENNGLREKLSSVLALMDEQAEAHKKQVEAKDAATQSALAKLQEHLAVMEQQQQHVQLLVEQNQLLEAREAQLKEQLQEYSAKFKDVQETVGQTNTVFEELRKQAERYRKKNAALEGQHAELQKSSQKANAMLISLHQERTTFKAQMDVKDAEMKRLKLQRDRLESLCRTLQAQTRNPPSGDADADTESPPAVGPGDEDVGSDTRSGSDGASPPPSHSDATQFDNAQVTRARESQTIPAGVPQDAVGGDVDETSVTVSSPSQAENPAAHEGLLEAQQEQRCAGGKPAQDADGDSAAGFDRGHFTETASVS